MVPQSLLGEVAVRASATDGEELFVGVASTSDAAAYLSGVAHATLVDFREVDGEATPVFQETTGRAHRAAGRHGHLGRLRQRRG